MYHTPNYCRLREYTNVVVACWHSIVQNAHALLDVVGQCFDSSVHPLTLL